MVHRRPRRSCAPFVLKGGRYARIRVRRAAADRMAPCEKSGRPPRQSARRAVYMRMPKTPRKSAPKVEVHGKGVSGFSQEDLDRRAHELALIDNRTSAKEEDRARALAEFQERDLPDAVNEDAESMQSMSRDPSDPFVDRGHQIPEYGGDDEKTVLEKMTLEGVEEAQHEQMVASRNNIDEPLRSRPKKKKKAEG